MISVRISDMTHGGLYPLLDHSFLASQGRPRPGSVLSCPECVTLRNGRGNIFWRGDLGTLFSMLQPSQSKWKQTKPEGVLWLSSG